MENKKVDEEKRYYVLKDVDDAMFSLKIDRHKATAEGIMAIIETLKKVHKFLGDTEEEIKKMYLQGRCICLASIISHAYKKGENCYCDELEFVRFTSPYDKNENELKQDFYDHYVARIKNSPDELYDIDGKQTLSFMKLKLSNLWTKDARLGKITTEDISFSLEHVSSLGGVAETTFCKNNIKHKPATNLNPPPVL